MAAGWLIGTHADNAAKDIIMRELSVMFMRFTKGRPLYRPFVFVSKETFSMGNGQGFAGNIHQTIPTFEDKMVSNMQNGDNTD